MTDRKRNGQIFGEIIREIREGKKTLHKKWTINYVAEQAKVQSNYLGKLERGEKGESYMTTIGRIAMVLEVSLDEIWKRYEEKIEKHKSL
ncbi:helix-turn-helix domain-containing protein [Aquibacillus koreensis]|uniref:Helix-turn-helix domain-containing protein n=1 Tax=Aquibacillus koreensis TaxID=279446 RepID=A0A9X3WJB4_9BACI|nr:helix-turn-helix transcriptional regulator [Aquibacillus koreensis]MCT2537049.1 helix-turn-helix domain-containing protein [Aquibacillus koreensis]MDC3419968.1 helix-turn-helix domain-containing protein [Aquibacillus koreensis]